MNKILVKSLLLLLTLINVGCAATTLSEFAAESMPTDVKWVLTSKSLATTLSDIRRLKFVEYAPDGTVIQEREFVGYPDDNQASCQNFSPDANPFNEAKKDLLVKLNNAALSKSPRLAEDELQRMNESKLGKFEILNTQGLWFVRDLTSLDVKGGTSIPNAFDGSLRAGIDQSNLLLIALVATLKFTVNDEFMQCTRDGYLASTDYKQALAKFRSGAKPGSRVASIVTRGAVIGSLLGLTVKSTSFSSAANAKLPPTASNAAFSLELSSSNVSLNYQQYGIIDSEFDLAQMLEILRTKQDAGKLLSRLRESTTKMAVVGTLVEEI